MPNTLRQQVLSLSTPIFVEQLFVALLGVVNTIMAARVGKEAVSAIGMIDSINNLVIALFSALGIGATVVVAQYSGRGEHARAAEGARQALVSAGLFAVVLAVLLGGFRVPLLQWLYAGSDAKVMAYMAQYLLITACSYPLMALSLVACAALRGGGEVRVPMLANTLMNVLNVLLGYVLIYGLQLHTEWFDVHIAGRGVAGAALAISLARLAGVAYLFWAMLRAGNCLPGQWLKGFRFDAALQRGIFSIGIPASVESLVFQGGKLIVQVMVVGLGTVAIAANFIAFSIAFLINIPGNALAIAATTLVGQHIGRNDNRAAGETLIYVLKTATVWLVGLGVLVWPLAPYIARLYAHDPEVIALTTLLVRINCCFMLFFATTFVLPAGLKGAGDARYAMVTTLVGMLIFRIALGWLLGIALGMGVAGLWLGMFADWIVRSALYCLRLRSGRWLAHRVVG